MKRLVISILTLLLVGCGDPFGNDRCCVYCIEGAYPCGNQCAAPWESCADPPGCACTG